MNKKGGGDIRTVTFAALAFFVLLGGGLSLTHSFLQASDVAVGDELESLTGLQNQTEYFEGISGSLDSEIEGEQEKEAGGLVVWLASRFEDTMLGKAFKTAKKIGEFNEVKTKVVGNDAINKAFMLNELVWLKWAIGIAIGLIILFAVVFFFRGLQG
jgi:hypothetical protein